MDNFVTFVEETAVFLVQVVRQIPVVKRNNRDDTSLNQIVHELDIVIHSLLVHGIVSSAKRDNSWPGDAESVGLCAKGFQQSDVLGCSMVGIAGRTAIGPVADLAGSIGECVPD